MTHNIYSPATRRLSRLKVLVALPLLVAMLVLAGCKNNKKEEPETLTPEQREAIRTEVAERVTAIYDEVFGWYRTHLDALDVPDFDTDRRLATDYLQTLQAVRKHDAQLKGEVGFFDNDHWIQGQDWDADLSMRIDSISVMAAEHSAAWITIHNCGTDTPLLLELMHEKDTWNINDFISLDEEKLSQYTLESAPMEKFQMKVYLGDEGVEMMTEQERTNYDQIIQKEKAQQEPPQAE